MNKIYFEMTEQERELTYLGQTVDYAAVKFAEGIPGTYGNFTTKDIIKIQSEITDHLLAANALINKLLENIYKLDDKLEDDVIECDDDNSVVTLICDEVGTASDIEKLKDCKVDYIGDVSNEKYNTQGIIITLKNEHTGHYIDLLKGNDGELSISQWY